MVIYWLRSTLPFVLEIKNFDSWDTIAGFCSDIGFILSHLVLGVFAILENSIEARLWSDILLILDLYDDLKSVKLLDIRMRSIREAKTILGPSSITLVIKEISNPEGVTQSDKLSENFELLNASHVCWCFQVGEIYQMKGDQSG